MAERALHDGSLADRRAWPRSRRRPRALLICAAPDFGQTTRSAVREAVLLTTTVDVPHAGLP
ncbi:MAG TPA: hypothetical protein VLA98_12435 [Solirubrobacteraceae bacterium]|nr:hypothetical protein [Solirubrobacteraceae bacterium]